MATCASPIWPPAVIRSVKEQMQTYQNDQVVNNENNQQVGSNSDAAAEVPESMLVKPCLQQADLRDAVVRYFCGVSDFFFAAAAAVRRTLDQLTEFFVIPNKLILISSSF